MLHVTFFANFIIAAQPAQPEFFTTRLFDANSIFTAFVAIDYAGESLTFADFFTHLRQKRRII